MSSKYRALSLQSEEAQVQSADGSQSTFFMNPPIELPKKQNREWLARITIVNIPYVTHNITSTKFNYFKYSYNFVPHHIIMEPGLYTLSSLNQKLFFYTRSQTGVTEPMFSLVADESSGKVFIEALTNNGFQISFDNDQGDNVMQICGFMPSMPSYSPNYIGEVYQSSSTASFDLLQNINIHVSFCSGCDSYSSQNSSDIVCTVTPDVSPQSRIIKEFQNPLIVGITQNQISQFTVSLRDQNNNALNMNPSGLKIENWSIVMQIFEETI